jgi:hypothetical protein
MVSEWLRASILWYSARLCPSAKSESLLMVKILVDGGGGTGQVFAHASPVKWFDT